jgi:hypothetical protein
MRNGSICPLQILFCFICPVSRSGGGGGPHDVFVVIGLMFVTCLGLFDEIGKPFYAFHLAHEDVELCLVPAS